MKHPATALRTYLAVFAVLIALTALTVYAASVELGRLNDAVAMMIAFIKVSLVGLFFMHLRGSPKLVWLTVGAGIFWLILLLGLTMTDYLSREWLRAAAG